MGTAVACVSILVYTGKNSPPFIMGSLAGVRSIIPCLQESFTWLIIKRATNPRNLNRCLHATPRISHPRAIKSPLE